MYYFKSEKYKTMMMCDHNGTPLLLPNLYLHSLHKNKTAYKLTWNDNSGKRRIKGAELTRVTLSDRKIKDCFYELRKFLDWLEVYSKNTSSISLSTHHNLPEDILNYYINEVLILKRNTSEKMVEKAVSGLKYYYNYLAYNGFTNIKEIRVKNDNKAIARDNTNRRNVIQYLSPRMRAELYANANSLRVECILRAGGECGLRTKENMGLLVNDFKVGSKSYVGMKSFFREIDHESKLKKSEVQKRQEFKYWLQGKYSKSRRGGIGGISRWIYIPRDLMLRFKLYYETERPECSDESLFLTDPQSRVVHGVRENQGTRDFAVTRDLVIEKQQQKLLPDYLHLLEDKHSYHILRHSYGTDKFHDAVEDEGLELENVTHLSRPYLLVAELLGHETKGKDAPKTTQKYIRSVKAKLDQDASFMRCCDG
ncbi:site-specific integrase [Thalassotalea sp. M1531]|uniref:Site-specific integrase n=1 Tax=Thalassotalea algicola TaxID=2716224 RepID=A0A7Y0LEC1_9GAMM|nr:site-specific integrase [Thalassotalea algicola]NMP32678.1 site-specific integrase [Thalassotalea algicola]